MRPDTITTSPLPRSAPMKRARPIVPAAPGMFSTGAVRTMPALLQRLLHHARGLIPAAAGRGRRDDAQLLEAGTIRGLCESRGGGGGPRRQPRYENAK